MHDSCVVVSLLKAIPIVLTVKILVIFKVLKGLAPWASVWCGGEWANAYPLKSLGGGSYIVCSRCFACGFVLLLEVFRVRFARVSCPRLRFVVVLW